MKRYFIFNYKQGQVAEKSKVKCGIFKKFHDKWNMYYYDN